MVGQEATMEMLLQGGLGRVEGVVAVGFDRRTCT